MKPFIHLFRTPKNYYFYDVNRNESIRINRDMYQYLHDMINDSENFVKNDILEEELEKLREKGYLSGNKVKEIRHPETDNLKLYQERQIDMLILQLTQSCNLRCNYCPYTSNDGSNRTHSNTRMTLDLAKRSLDYYRDRSIDSQQVNISFYGGEPLLEFELLKECVNYINHAFKGKGRNYFITTNGTLLDNEKAKFLDDNNFKVLISLDGAKKTNDSNRKFTNNEGSVFDTVIANIENINKNYKKLFSNLSINMVLDPSYSFEYYLSVFDEFEFLKDVQIRVSLIDDSSLVNKNKISHEFTEQFNYYSFLSYLHVFGRIDLEKRFFLLDSFLPDCIELLNGLRRTMSLGMVNAPSGPCIPGKLRLMVNSEGKMFPCERVSETIDRNCIGNSIDGINLESAQKLLNIASTNEYMCKNCFAFRHCTLCAKAHECTSISRDLLVEKCNECRSSFHNILVDIEILKEIRYDKLI